MEEEGIDKFDKRFTFIHPFNSGRGPLLEVVMILRGKHGSEMLLAYKWHGSGEATLKEFKKLLKVYQEKEPAVAEFIERVVM